MTKVSFAKERQAIMRRRATQGESDNRISYSVHKTANPYAHFYIGEFFMNDSGFQIGDKVDIIMDTDDGYTTIKRMPGDTQEPFLLITRNSKSSGRGKISMRWGGNMPRPDRLIVMEGVECKPNVITFNFPNFISYEEE